MSSLCTFTQLQTLVLDDNELTTIASLPPLPSLRALSLNNNELTDLHNTIIAIQSRCSKLTFLSLLGNPCCPCELRSSSYAMQKKNAAYRAQVIMALPDLQHLDFRATDTEEPLVPPWLLMDTPIERAVALVAKADHQAFLIVSFIGRFQLLVNDSGTVASYNILSDDNGLRFRFGGRLFFTLEAMVEFINTLELEGPSGKLISIGQPAPKHDVNINIDMSSDTQAETHRNSPMSPSNAPLPWDEQNDGRRSARTAGTTDDKVDATSIISKLPPPYEWIVLDTKYPVDFDNLQDALFGTSLEWWHKYYAMKNYSNVVCTQWCTNQREINYTIPAHGLNPQVVVHERHDVLIDNNNTFVVSVTSRTPGVPYGSHFKTLVQYVIQSKGASMSYLRISAEASWSKSCLLKSTITKKLKSSLFKSFEHIKAYADKTWGV